MVNVKDVIDALTKLVSILMEFISLIETKISGTFRRVSLLINIFKSTSEKSLQRILTLVRFFSKFNGDK